MASNIQPQLEKQSNSIFLHPLTLLPLTSFFFIILYKYLHQKTITPRRNLPPSPPKLPIIGNLHQLGSHPHHSLNSFSHKYGELMLIQLGSTPTLVVSSARAARAIMSTHDITFANRPMSKKGERLLYNYKDIVGAPYGEYWRQMKSICVLNLLSNKRVRSFRSVREEETNILVQKIRDAEKKSSPVNLTEVLIEFTNDLICRVAFGRKYNGEEENGIDFNGVMNEFNKLIADFNVGDFIPWLGWIDKFNGWDKKVDKIAKKFDGFLEKVVQEHEDRLNDRKKVEDDENGKDIVDVLLDVQKDKMLRFAIDRDSIKAVILDMFSGGTDTTYTVLEWAMTELFRHPTTMKRLQKEVREIIGQKTYLNEDDLEEMKYLKAVIKETLRLHPPIPLLVPRQSTQETKINGYDIPSGTAVIINAWAIHRDPAFWHEPENFNPERFVSSPTDFRGQSFELIPFGGGRRICPGIQFAMAINELVLANLVYKFDWVLPGGADIETLDMSESVGLTKHRKTPLLAVATPAKF